MESRKFTEVELQVAMRKAWCEGYKFGSSTIETKANYFMVDLAAPYFKPDNYTPIKDSK